MKSLFLCMLVLCLGISLSAEDNVVEKRYLVKGMHCGGCESGVRASLKTLGGLKDQEILKVDHTKPDAKKQIGQVVVRFSETKYEGITTDCKLAKAIKKNPGYELYWEKNNTNPCKL